MTTTVPSRMQHPEGHRSATRTLSVIPALHPSNKMAFRGLSSFRSANVGAGGGGGRFPNAHQHEVGLPA